MKMKRILAWTSLTLSLPVLAVPQAECADSLAQGSSYELDNVEIVQIRKLVQSDSAKLVYNVNEDPEAASSPLLEILRKVPGVTVDGEDNVRVNGQTNFRILLNGHEDAMLQGDIKALLKSFPASTIKKIEVISDPGAKYEAEGVGGILNIITNSGTRMAGFLGRLSGSLSTNSWNTSLYGRGKLGNVMLGANAVYSSGHTPWPSDHYRSWSEVEDFTGKGPALTRTRNTQRSGGWDYTGINIDGSWEPDTLNLFTFGINFDNNYWSQPGENLREAFAADGSPLWRLVRYSYNNSHDTGTGANFSYQHTFGEEHTLVASYLFGYGHNSQGSRYEEDSAESWGPAASYPYNASSSRTNLRNHVAQIDYANRFSPRHLLEAGAKASLRSQGTRDETFADTPVEMMDLTQIRDIFALYASYTGTYAKWGLRAGLRYEYTRTGLRYRVAGYTDFTRNLNDLVPDLAVNYNLTPASSLRLSYSQRIERPDLWALNPYADNLTPGKTEYGNPRLKSAHNHSFSIGYSNYDHPLTGSVKVGYRHADNLITDIIFMRDGIYNSTYANLGKRTQGFGDLDLGWNITKAFMISGYYRINYADYRADSPELKQKNHGWQQNVGGYAQYRTPRKWTVSANGGYWTPWIDLQSHGDHGYYYGLGLNKSFLKDDTLKFSLGLNNILPLKRKSFYTQGDETMQLRNGSTFRQWNVYASVAWTFGGLKVDVKRTAASAEADCAGSAPSK